MKVGSSVEALRGRVSDAAQQVESKEFLTGPYLATLLDTMFYQQDQYTRRFVRISALCAVFVLLAGSSVSQVSIAGIQIEDFGPILKFLPAVIAYTFLQLACHICGMRIAERTAVEVIRQHFPAIDQGQLHRIALARTVPALEWLVKVSTWSSLCRPFVYTIGATLTVLGALVGPISFAIYAFWKCFALFGAGDPLLWLSLAVTVSFLVEGGALFVAVYSSPLGGGRGGLMRRLRSRQVATPPSP